MPKAQLYIVSAPSGAGKTSLVNAVAEEIDDLGVSVSTTTRARRADEVDGVNYHFVDQAEFERMIKADRFLEFARVFNNYYGTSRDWVDEQLEAGKDVILEIDWQGARQARERYARCLSVFILPPSCEELERRLTRRGQDDAAIIQARMRAAMEEMEHYQEYDFLVINDDFARAVADLRAIIRAGRLKTAIQSCVHDLRLKQLMASR